MLSVTERAEALGLSPEQYRNFASFLQHKIASHLELRPEDMLPHTGKGYWKVARACTGGYSCRGRPDKPYRHRFLYSDTRCHAAGICPSPWETWMAANAAYQARIAPLPHVTMILDSGAESVKASMRAYVDALPAQTVVVQGPLSYLNADIEHHVDRRDDLHIIQVALHEQRPYRGGRETDYRERILQSTHRLVVFAHREYELDPRARELVEMAKRLGIPGAIHRADAIDDWTGGGGHRS